MTNLVGAHTILYSANAEADRAFLQEVLELPHVDVGDGWLIFGLPPGEIAIHPAETSGAQEIFLMVADVEAFVADMRERGLDCTEPSSRGWGILTTLTLPGGGALSVYEPQHASPKPAPVAKKAKVKKAKDDKKKAKDDKKKAKDDKKKTKGDKKKDKKK